MVITDSVCRIDQLGRIVIPRSIKILLDIKTEDIFEIYITKGNLMIKRISFTYFPDFWNNKGYVLLDAIRKEDEDYIFGGIHPVDNSGRIVIPTCLREKLGFNPGVKCELYLEGGIIVVKKFKYEWPLPDPDLIYT